ncbi:oxidoreductase [Ascochyta rabiei]|uniref:Oxidoreductase n=1 Tax=Didymella rabiei TaxID=5454 RepID=A0A163J377_DIDRA|nr:oxidoreductase [Ascochyta rabiei]
MLATRLREIISRANEFHTRGVDWRNACIYMRDLRSQAVPHSDDIESVDEVPIIVIHTLNGNDVTLLPNDACQIRTAVQLAEGLHGSQDPRLDLLALGHIDNSDEDMRACCLQLCPQGFERLFLDVDKGKLGAFACKQTSGLKAHARRCAGGDDDLILE